MTYRSNMLHNGLFQVFMVGNTIPLTLCSASIEFLLDIAMLSLHNYNELANLFGKGFWLTIAFSKLFTSHWLYVCIIVQQRTICIPRIILLQAFDLLYNGIFKLNTFCSSDLYFVHRKGLLLFSIALKVQVQRCVCKQPISSCSKFG